MKNLDRRAADKLAVEAYTQAMNNGFTPDEAQEFSEIIWVHSVGEKNLPSGQDEFLIYHSNGL